MNLNEQRLKFLDKIRNWIKEGKSGFEIAYEIDRQPPDLKNLFITRNCAGFKPSFFDEVKKYKNDRVSSNSPLDKWLEHEMIEIEAQMRKMRDEMEWLEYKKKREKNRRIN